MEQPTEPPKSIWKKSWKGSRALLVFIAVLAFLAITLSYSFLAILDSKIGTAAALALAIALALAAILGVLLLYRILKWICHWRNLRKVLFALVCLITLIALIYVEEDVRGKIAWNKFKRAAEAKGEKFDLDSFIPPPVPDEQNLAMTPLLRPLYDFERATNGSWRDFHWRDTNALSRLDGINIWLGMDWAAYHDNSTNSTPDLEGRMETNTLTDLSRFQKFYSGNTNYPQPSAPGTPAADVLIALSNFDKELSELREAAASRPECRFPIHYDDESPFTILLPHLARIKGLTQTLQLRAIAYLESGRSDEALADVQTAFRLSDAIRNEPFLICYLVRVAALQIDLATALRHGLVRHQWNENQLAEIQKYLASIDLLAEYEHNMRGERAFNLKGMDYYRTRGFFSKPIEVYDMNEDGGVNTVSTPAFNIMPNGWFYQNDKAIAEDYQKFILPSVNEKEHRVFPQIADAMLPAIKAHPTPYNIFARMMMPAFSRSAMRCARSQTAVDQVLVACALERYRLAHGGYPDNLSALVPQFLEKIPIDVIDGKPLRYKKLSGDSYILYSVGWDEKDDGGTVVLHKGSTSTDPKKGDWIWLLP